MNYVITLQLVLTSAVDYQNNFEIKMKNRLSDCWRDEKNWMMSLR